MPLRIDTMYQKDQYSQCFFELNKDIMLHILLYYDKNNERQVKAVLY